jgi:hypothetical protein
MITDRLSTPFPELSGCMPKDLCGVRENFGQHEKKKNDGNVSIKVLQRRDGGDWGAPPPVIADAVSRLTEALDTLSQARYPAYPLSPPRRRPTFYGLHGTMATQRPRGNSMMLLSMGSDDGKLQEHVSCGSRHAESLSRKLSPL